MAESCCTSGVKSVANYSRPCVGAACFSFTANWTSGGPATTLPAVGFAVRKIEAFVYQDGKTYAYTDVVNYSECVPTRFAVNIRHV